MAAQLSEQQRRFVDHYLAGKPATQAYIAAGYKANESAARTNAARLLSNDRVAAYVAEQRERLRAAASLNREQVVAGLMREAQLRGKGSAHSARVSAWGLLAKIGGLFPEQPAAQTNVTLNIGPDWRFLKRRPGEGDVIEAEPGDGSGAA